MVSRLVTVLVYAVRSSGMLLVGLTCLVVAWFAMFGEKPSIVSAAGAAWIMASVVLSWPRLPDAWRNDPPTVRQLEYAASLGILVPQGCSKGRLSDMISAAKQARESSF